MAGGVVDRIKRSRSNFLESLLIFEVLWLYKNGMFYAAIGLGKPFSPRRTLNLGSDLEQKIMGTRVRNENPG